MTELITLVGGAYSNSYVTLAEANLIASNFPWYTDWNTYTDTQKTQALIQAAFAMQQLPWEGTKCSPAVDAGKTYPNYETFFQEPTVGSLTRRTAPFELDSAGAAVQNTQTAIVWGTPGALMDIEVKSSIRMAPSSRTSSATLRDVDNNVINIGSIEGSTAVAYTGRFSTIVAEYSNLADPIGGTDFGAIYVDGIRLVNYADPPSGAAQRLAWPRSGVTCDGEVADCTFIPETIKITQVMIAYNFLKNPSDVPGSPGGGSQAPAGTYIKRQKIDVLEIEYDQFSGAQYNDGCGDCDDPYLIQTYPWLRDLLGCWLDFKSGSDNRLIRLFRN